MYQLHRTVVYKHMFQGYFRIVFCYFLYDFSPQTRGIQYICFVYACYFLSSLHRDLKCFNSDSSDFFFIIRQGIRSCHHAILFFGLSFSEVKTSGQFSDDDHVKSVTDPIFF